MITEKTPARPEFAVSPRRQIPVFVLTLETAQSRRAPLLAQLRKLGLEHELFFGVDGRTGLPSQYEPLIDRSARVNNIRRPMTDGEYACALSHLFIHRQIVARGLPEAIILEDDAIIGSYVADLACGTIPMAGDLMLLDHQGGFFRRWGKKQVTKELTAYRISTAPDLTTGYVITRRAAERFLRDSFPVRYLADWPCRIDKMKSYAIHPRIVSHPDQQEGPSELRSERDSLNSAFAKNKLPKPGKIERLLTRVYWERKIQRRLHQRISSAVQLGQMKDVNCFYERKDVM